MASPRLATFIDNKLNRIRGKREVGARCIVPRIKKDNKTGRAQFIVPLQKNNIFCHCVTTKQSRNNREDNKL